MIVSGAPARVLAKQTTCQQPRPAMVGVVIGDAGSGDELEDEQILGLPVLSRSRRIDDDPIDPPELERALHAGEPRHDLGMIGTRLAVEHAAQRPLVREGVPTWAAVLAPLGRVDPLIAEVERRPEVVCAAIVDPEVGAEAGQFGRARLCRARTAGRTRGPAGRTGSGTAASGRSPARRQRTRPGRGAPATRRRGAPGARGSRARARRRPAPSSRQIAGATNCI